MPKDPKFKRGYTFHHYFDEWWDRRSQEWKIKCYLGMGGLVACGFAGLLLWMYRWTEREQILIESRAIHQQRIQGADKIIGAGRVATPALRLRDHKKIETRPTE